MIPVNMRNNLITKPNVLPGLSIKAKKPILSCTKLNINEIAPRKNIPNPITDQ